MIRPRALLLFRTHNLYKAKTIFKFLVYPYNTEDKCPNTKIIKRSNFNTSMGGTRGINVHRSISQHRLHWSIHIFMILHIYRIMQILKACRPMIGWISREIAQLFSLTQRFNMKYKCFCYFTKKKKFFMRNLVNSLVFHKNNQFIFIMI